MQMGEGSTPSGDAFKLFKILPVLGLTFSFRCAILSLQEATAGKSAINCYFQNANITINTHDKQIRKTDKNACRIAIAKKMKRRFAL